MLAGAAGVQLTRLTTARRLAGRPASGPSRITGSRATAWAINFLLSALSVKVCHTACCLAGVERLNMSTAGQALPPSPRHVRRATGRDITFPATRHLHATRCGRRPQPTRPSVAPSHHVSARPGHKLLQDRQKNTASGGEAAGGGSNTHHGPGWLKLDFHCEGL